MCEKLYIHLCLYSCLHLSFKNPSLFFFRTTPAFTNASCLRYLFNHLFLFWFHNVCSFFRHTFLKDPLLKLLITRKWQSKMETYHCDPVGLVQTHFEPPARNGKNGRKIDFAWKIGEKGRKLGNGPKPPFWAHLWPFFPFFCHSSPIS